MVARLILIACCTFGFLQTSFAGIDRFWFFSKSSDNSKNQDETWEQMSIEEQRALIKRYQDLKELPADQNQSLQQRMDWFTQLPEQDKQKMREAWQQMSSTERADMRKKLEKATTAEQRSEIRNQYLQKYVSATSITN
ncbi:DUF3106 domain-containing protein [Acinetobacter rudis]|uniref:DNA phosphorothioation-dependent restriction protein DptG n=1 Tax=Acinetobacter rudis CIP 110305 TaxID=421052 RepID=S3NMR8_9GAMM|nr:DUF3106 domain-containing protein [Acinetobacter rudis]EPF79598.1 hypothetical protein F945_00962 [Acinetobacter rudis CIP 110305]